MRKSPLAPRFAALDADAVDRSARAGFNAHAESRGVSIRWDGEDSPSGTGCNERVRESWRSLARVMLAAAADGGGS